MKNTILILLSIIICSLNACGQKIGIIGSGNVGSTLGKKWAKAGFTILYSSRQPEELDQLVKETGANAKAVTVDQAAKESTIIVLAVPFKAEASLSKQISNSVKNKPVILCDNAYVGRDGAVAEDAKEMGVALYAQKYYYPSSHLVRAFSSLAISTVGAATASNPITIPYATDNEGLKPLIELLIKSVDGSPKYIGTIKESKSLDF